MMKRGNRHRFTPFAALSQHRQRDAFVKLRWKILRDTPVYGGLFTSHLVLDEPGRPDAYRQWFDVLFPGLDGRSIWNATVITGNLRFWERIQDLASEQTRSRLTDAELEEEYRWKFSPAFYVGRQKFYRMIRSEPRHHAALDGLTLREYEERTASEILHNTPPEIHESFRLDHSYRYGIGLEIVTDSPIVDRAAIERSIRRFRELGETDWQSPDPIPRDHLPFQTEAEALAAAAPHAPQG
ncbi:hypothetical protein MR829_14720 [Paracoccus versutus]|uniref:hypothetical protein n=1 Tax=Paracoccus versutus TaxID=34007 RepID=UPI001FB5E26C|nr:hypothetical protein [Paracoccus versutus]MCJ1901623.1 hypothetical protein [Paracoccus versutus]